MPEDPAATVSAELKFLADLSQPLVYVPSKGGGDQTEHQGNFRTHPVEVHDARRSASVATQQARGIREPANIVHNDYTAASGPRRLTDFFADAPEEAEALRRGRFAIINAWRPINGPVYDQPLVLCDAGSIADGDLVAMERRAEERIGELQVALFNPGQRWYYYPRMHPGEVLLFKTYDSAEDGRARFTPHSSFSDPSAPPDAPPRESLESRCLVFF